MQLTKKVKPLKFRNYQRIIGVHEELQSQLQSFIISLYLRNLVLWFTLLQAGQVAPDILAKMCNSFTLYQKHLIFFSHNKWQKSWKESRANSHDVMLLQYEPLCMGLCAHKDARKSVTIITRLQNCKYFLRNWPWSESFMLSVRFKVYNGNDHVFWHVKPCSLVCQYNGQLILTPKRSMKYNRLWYTYLTKGLEKISARHRDHDVYVVNNEQRLILYLVGKVGQVVRQVQHLWQAGFLKIHCHSGL